MPHGSTASATNVGLRLAIHYSLFTIYYLKVANPHGFAHLS
jgi:hypothetical protein